MLCLGQIKSVPQATQNMYTFIFACLIQYNLLIETLRQMVKEGGWLFKEIPDLEEVNHFVHTMSMFLQDARE